jgi:low molecular weight protein-tyrosine phosphatase
VPRSEHFGILFVCTGNVCRSVLAERLTRRGIRARLGDEAARFAVTSAGTAARGGSPMHPYISQALASLDAEAGGFASRQLTAGDIEAADLVLCACAEHRDQVLTMCPGASRRCFLLREFARLAAAMPVPAGPAGAVPAGAGAVAGGPAGAVAAAARLRGRVRYVEPAEDEIPDPAADPEAFGACAREIDGVLAPVLDALCGTVSSPVGVTR